MKYDMKMIAACMGMTEEQYRRANADKLQGVMAALTIKLALAGRGGDARKMAQRRDARIQRIAKRS